MNGHRPAGADEPVEQQVQRLRAELEATRAEVQRLRDLRSSMEVEQQRALRDAVLRTRETIREMEREHEASLRRIEEDALAEIERIRARGAAGDRP